MATIRTADTRIKTPRGTFRLSLHTVDQMKALGFSFHHSSPDGRYSILAGNATAYAVDTTLTPEAASKARKAARAKERRQVRKIAAADKAPLTVPDHSNYAGDQDFGTCNR